MAYKKFSSASLNKHSNWQQTIIENGGSFLRKYFLFILIFILILISITEYIRTGYNRTNHENQTKKLFGKSNAIDPQSAR